MARLTVEDCLGNVDNRFELVLKAAKRARELERGAVAKVAWNNDKSTVVALREIAEGLLDEVESVQPEEVSEEIEIVEEVEKETE